EAQVLEQAQKIFQQRPAGFRKYPLTGYRGGRWYAFDCAITHLIVLLDLCYYAFICAIVSYWYVTPNI
ncbi:hypothetical protein, partial [Klebsiella pneumoniae]|uniref:hypothetical protein n=1 Tax=Klebsiella pneumoniae TaxID=573 RepID=UPI00405547BE